ncbi:MAG: DUF1292 domain-containing protein [Lachnospiraceae bacterium]|nr:DUF1292 domain-containing protein [Lachnospiraceae bacterium]
MDKIKIETETGAVEFYILEQTVVGGKNYYLATEDAEGDSDAYILRDDSKAEEEDAALVFVEDESELKAIGDIFASLLDDTDIV